MPKNQGKLTRFWQELKRRKVFGVVTTYAATAYIIIEVTNNLVGPLNLPAWIAKLVILLLGAGLPVAVILSWMFDFTPQGIKKTESFEEIEKKETLIKPVKRKLRPSYILNAVLIIAVIILAYPKIFKRNTLEKLRSSGERISVAVMPFQNMTNDTTWNVWQKGVQINLVASLSNNPEELSVRQIESITTILKSKGLTDYASITSPVASSISQKLDANVCIQGSISQSGSTVRINAQLIDSKTQEIFKSFQNDGTADSILPIIDSLSVKIKDFLIISVLKKKIHYPHVGPASTNSPEAYRYFVYGVNAFIKGDMLGAVKFYLQSIKIDSNFIAPYLNIIPAYYNPGLHDQAKKWALKAYEKRDQMSPIDRLNANEMYAWLFQTPEEDIECCKQMLEIDDQDPILHYSLGLIYEDVEQYDKAIPEFEKALEIFNKWDSKPWWVSFYTQLGLAYHKTGQYKEERKIYKKANRFFRDNPDSDLFFWPTVLELTEGDTVVANQYIEKFISLCKSQSYTEDHIMQLLAIIYSEAGIMDKAEEIWRKALSLEPENPGIMANLAYFLIDKNRNIDEGMVLANKALELQPDSYGALHAKGWGLYKKNKYQDAFEMLQKSWDLRREKAAKYNHQLYLHLEAAKKAVAGLK